MRLLRALPAICVAEIGYVEVLLPPHDRARCGGFSNMFICVKPVNTILDCKTNVGRVLVKNLGLDYQNEMCPW